jgi:hypothetical protein
MTPRLKKTLIVVLPLVGLLLTTVSACYPNRRSYHNRGAVYSPYATAPLDPYQEYYESNRNHHDHDYEGSRYYDRGY